MIDEKKIEEAANKYAKKKEKLCEKLAEKYKSANSLCSIVTINPDAAFKDGINWFKENLWHDASEEPRTHKLLFVEYSGIDRTYGVTILTDVKDEWEDKAKEGNITRWLYIEDLMKGGK